MELDAFASFTFGIIVLFLGRSLNKRVAFFREFNIPEPVTGGLLIAIITLLIFIFTDFALSFDLAVRDALIIYFFTGIGLNADFRTLLTGGKPLVLLLIATIVYMLIQNLTGTSMMGLLGLDPKTGLLTGTVSLIGGHGTAIAWSPQFESDHGIASAMEIGIASATFGLILASLIGGPIARFLISRYDLKSEKTTVLDVGVAEHAREEINYLTILRCWLVLNITIGFGLGLNEGLAEAGLKLPDFVACLLVGIFITNTVPRVLPRLHWPSQTPSLGLISELTLGVFLSMSLMSLQLWSLAELGGPILITLLVQAVVAAAFILFVVFNIMGRNYQAAVLCSGFGGFALGATPTAIANMTAVVARYGPAHQAFIILPLVSAFFIDLANAFIIPYFLNLL
ncbi:sodium/glutamate symporter [Rhodovibrionaceae bacterium A322]